MAFNGSGTFVRSHNWVTDKTNVVPVTASRMDTECDGFATGLSTALCKDGQQTATARIPFALGVSSMAGSVSSASFAQISDLNTGMYFPAVDQWGLTAGGVATLTSTATIVTCPVQLNVTGDIVVADDIFIGDDLSVTGISSFFDDVTILNANLAVQNITTTGTVAVAGNFAVGANTFTVAAASGNTVVAGTLGVTGTTTAAAVNGTAITASGALSGATAAGAMLASQAEQEAGTAADKLVMPGRQHFHQSACKCWGLTTGGNSPALHANSYNVTSITDNSTGNLTVTIATDFSSADWSGQVSTTTTVANEEMCSLATKAAGSVILLGYDEDGVEKDPGVGYDWAFFGDQA